MATVSGSASLTVEVGATATGSSTDTTTNFFFTPPIAFDNGPFPVADSKYGPTSVRENWAGVQLMKYFPSSPVGCNVYMLEDGTFLMDIAPAGWPNRAPLLQDSSGNYPMAQLGQPWPAQPARFVSTGYISANVVAGVQPGPNGDISAATTYGPILQPVRWVWFGAHSSPLTLEQYAALVNAGFGGYITSGPPPANFPPTT